MQNTKPWEELSDRELYEKCRLYGGNARAWSKKFAALLPEVERRRLYAKYGFYSIFEFAAKLAGMRRETVLEILRVAEKLQDKPLLLAQLPEQGWSKMKVIVNIATPENEKNLAEKVKEMSKATLETFVNELKKQNHELVQNRPGAENKISQNGQQSDFEQSAQYVEHPRISVRMPLKPQTELRLRQLQRKLSRAAKAPVDFNEVIETLLDAYEKSRPRPNKGSRTTIVTSREPEPMPELPTTVPRYTDIAVQKKQVKRELPIVSSRYIPVKVRKIVDAEHGGRCAYPDCKKLPEIYHHTRRFALFPNHDPGFLVPLCKTHERLAHNGLIENEEQSPERWQVKMEADKTSPKYWIDRKVNGWRATSVPIPPPQYSTISPAQKFL